MKLKLIVIAVLALLLCAVVPMAVTAAKEKTTFTTKLYVGVPDPDNGGWLKGKNAGKLVFSDDNKWTLVPSNGAKLSPGSWDIAVAPSNLIIGSVYVDQNGALQPKTNQPIGYQSTSYTSDEVAGWLDDGGWIFIGVGGS